MSKSTKDKYESFEDGNSRADAADSLGSISSGSGPSSLDPGTQIELSAAVSGVVPDGNIRFLF